MGPHWKQLLILHAPRERWRGPQRLTLHPLQGSLWLRNGEECGEAGGCVRPPWRPLPCVAATTIFTTWLGSKMARNVGDEAAEVSCFPLPSQQNDWGLTDLDHSARTSGLGASPAMCPDPISGSGPWGLLPFPAYLDSFVMSSLRNCLEIALLLEPWGTRFFDPSPSITDSLFYSFFPTSLLFWSVNYRALLNKL